MREMRIAGKVVGAGQKPFVIAEVGSNHDGSLENAKKYIKAIAETGADAAKFQLFTAPTLLNSEVMDENNQWSTHPAWQIIEDLSLPETWLPELVACCEENNILFCCTPFSEEAVDQLEKINIPFYKVASGELTHPLLLEKVGRTGKPVVLSTGMGNMKEVKLALTCLKEAGCKDLAVLHCVSNYPPRDEDSNLTALIGMQEELGEVVGLSDHSPASALCVVALALGARVFEKHVTFDRNSEGPDHPFALEMDEFKTLVEDLNRAWLALGSGGKHSVAAEEEMKIHARRGVYARRDLEAGEVLTEEMIRIVRPLMPGCLAASEIKEVLGKTLKEAVTINRPLK
jgi:N,N'-diacetyllegionaminate synthase